MLTAGEKQETAEALRRAEATRTPIVPLSDTWPAIDLPDAYEIQLTNISRRLQDGAIVRGHKVGLTSRAMQEMLGVDEPDYGHLLDDMFVTDSSDQTVDRYCTPRVEVEIGFVLHAPLEGPGVTVADVVRATDYVAPCLEIIDSRIRDWRIKLVDTIADNASSAGIVIGETRTPPDRVELTAVDAELRRNGEIIDAGSSEAVLGNPATAVAWLANKLAAFGTRLEAGHVVLPGSCTRAHDVSRGDHVRADFDGLGHVQVSFV
jgi:2-keto-4-pentenoate hydratase